MVLVGGVCGATNGSRAAGIRLGAADEDVGSWHFTSNGQLDFMSGFGRSSEADGGGGLARRDANDPEPT